MILNPNIGDWSCVGGVNHPISKNELKRWLDGLIEFKPITLTDGWLVRAGFKKQEVMLNAFDKVMYLKDGYRIYLDRKGFFYTPTHNRTIFFPYVHSLQSAWVVFTGSELIFE